MSDTSDRENWVPPPRVVVAGRSRKWQRKWAQFYQLAIGAVCDVGIKVSHTEATHQGERRTIDPGLSVVLFGETPMLSKEEAAKYRPEPKPHETVPAPTSTHEEILARREAGRQKAFEEFQERRRALGLPPWDPLNPPAPRRGPRGSSLRDSLPLRDPDEEDERFGRGGGN